MGKDISCWRVKRSQNYKKIVKRGKATGADQTHVLVTLSRKRSGHKCARHNLLLFLMFNTVASGFRDEQL